MPTQVKLADAKAKLSAIVDEVQATGKTIEITKRGIPAAWIVPAKKKQTKDAYGILHEYANETSRAHEEGAWARAINESADF